MTIAYPFGLRTIISASKSRTQPAAFTMSEPRKGYAYAQAVGTDVPVFWDVGFKFTQLEAIRFKLFVDVTLQRGLLEFTLPIATEFGMVTHTVRFLPDGLSDCTESGGIYTYGGKIMARALAIPQGYIDAAGIIVGLPDWDEWMIPLDTALARIPA